MKNLIIIILIVAPIFSCSAQRWNTTELSVKVKELQTADDVMQVSINELNAGITKVLALMKSQDSTIAIQNNKIKKLEDTAKLFRTLYVDTSRTPGVPFSFRLKNDTLTIKTSQ